MSGAEHECPACPECGLDIATPIAVSRYGGPPELTTDRWNGDSDCNLWCPACGHGWRGSQDQYNQALQAWLEYEREAQDPAAAEGKRLYDLLHSGTLMPEQEQWLRQHGIGGAA